MDGLRRTNCRYKKARIAGFQDFVSGSGDHLQRILVELAGVEREYHEVFAAENYSGSRSLHMLRDIIDMNK